jgi:hypothetical protein
VSRGKTAPGEKKSFWKWKKPRVMKLLAAFFGIFDIAEQQQLYKINTGSDGLSKRRPQNVVKGRLDGPWTNRAA